MSKRSTTNDRAEHANPAKKKAKRGPAPLGELLTHARNTAARRAGVALDHTTWREVAGERIAQRSAPGAIQDGVLTVVVASPVWAQELSFLSEEIVGRLKQRGLRVASIRFRTGTVEPSEPKAPARRVPKPSELPDDAKQRLAQVEDPALRELIAAAMGQALANQAREERAALKPTPAARAPRSAERGSARSARGEAPRSARPRRSREGR